MCACVVSFVNVAWCNELVDYILVILMMVCIHTYTVCRGVVELERDITFILGLMAIKVEHQQAICDANALPTLVGIVTRYSMYGDGVKGTHAQACRRAADAITNLAHENNSVKNMVRTEGGIPPLVWLLTCDEPKVQRAVAGTLRTLAFKNEDNKNMIVNLDALPLLIQMLRAEDASIHYEAVGVIGNLVHSSQHIKVQVLTEGALQPVIDLLSSPCPDSQREAALLLGQFATVEADYKSKIVQRGAVPPLVKMLSNPDSQLKEMAAFALGRLAQHPDNQAGIVAMGGLKPLLDLLENDLSNLQHNAAFALYGLSENEDNLLHFVRDGAVQRIFSCNLGPQASRDCVQKMTKRLQDKLEGHVMEQILYILQGASSSYDKQQRQTISIALGLLCTGEPNNVDPISVGNRLIKKGVLRALCEVVSTPFNGMNIIKQGATAIANIARYTGTVSGHRLEPMSPPEPGFLRGEESLNNQSMSDVTFVVEGREFHANRDALLSRSRIFKSMFDGNYKEKEASCIPIPNIRWSVFEAMMRYIYTGTVDVTPDLAQELLQAADLYMLDSLKKLCGAAIAEHLTPENVEAAFELSEAYMASDLANSCCMFVLENPEACSKEVVQICALMSKMIPRLENAIVSHVAEQIRIKVDYPEREYPAELDNMINQHSPSATYSDGDDMMMG